MAREGVSPRCGWKHLADSGILHDRGLFTAGPGTLGLLKTTMHYSNAPETEKFSILVALYCRRWPVPALE